MAIILAADVGGTEALVATFSCRERHLELIMSDTYKSSKFSSLEAIFRQFLIDHPTEIDAISVGLAGPVVDGRVEMTNLGWFVDQRNIEQEFSCYKVLVMNDLVAHAHGVEILPEDGRVVLKKGMAKLGNKAIIASGTGLGEAIMLWSKRYKKYIKTPTEGGHCNFGPTSLEEIDLLKFAMERHDHVSVEMLISGGFGFTEIFKYLCSTGKYSKEDIPEQLFSVDNVAPFITQYASEGYKICEDTIRLFIKLYGSEAGNLALKALAIGGIYICGGVINKILPWVSKYSLDFIEKFGSKGPMSSILSEVPIYIVTDELNAMKGAAWRAVKDLDL